MIASLRPSEPLPGDPNGKRLCEVFGRYLWNAITALLPEDASEKPQWQTLIKHPLRPRSLWTLWQDANTLVGVRFTHDTLYALLDLDAGGRYCNGASVAQIRAALETIGITRTLLVRSSWNGGLHLYIPLPEAVNTFNLAVALKECLKSQGFVLKAGQLEIFPNVKAYGVTAFTEYQAHRLPLQPSSGSCLLDDDLNPISDSLSRFFWLWDGAASHQDLESLKDALKVGRNNHRKRPKRRSHPVESWRNDLEAEIAEGWTDYGQTNYLLKTIACYGIVFEHLGGEELETYMLRIATKSPGYEQYCRHQSEIAVRVKVWAKAAENYYWPMGGEAKRTTNLYENNIVPFNQQRADEAQERIKEAVATLAHEHCLPEGVTARAEAIMSEGKVSKRTLYKYLVLWHPEHREEGCRRDETVRVSADLTAPPPDPEKAEEIREVYTLSQFMKGGRPDLGEGGSDPHSNSPDGGVWGGKSSFPQPPYPPPNPLLPPVEVLMSIQNQIQRLQWTAAQVVSFIASRFGGRRRSQLQDDELIALLYYLQNAAPEEIS
ncbi:MAG TPA: hypothetical protein V6D29_06485 [Leptolyngbyaceae cyanobacterium]